MWVPRSTLRSGIEHAQDTSGNAQTRLTELRQLYDQRLITQEEYEQKRKEILEEL